MLSKTLHVHDFCKSHSVHKIVFSWLSGWNDWRSMYQSKAKTKQYLPRHEFGPWEDLIVDIGNYFIKVIQPLSGDGLWVYVLLLGFI